MSTDCVFTGGIRKCLEIKKSCAVKQANANHWATMLTRDDANLEAGYMMPTHSLWILKNWLLYFYTRISHYMDLITPNDFSFSSYLHPCSVMCSVGQGHSACVKIDFTKDAQKLNRYTIMGSPLSVPQTPLYRIHLPSPPYSRPQRGNPILLIKQGPPGQGLKCNL